MTGIYFDTVTNDWAISLEVAGGVVGYAATASAAATRLDAEIERHARYHATQAQSLAAMLPSQSAQIAQAVAADIVAAPVAVGSAQSVASSRTRCAWHSAIRYFFGQAKGAALDTKDECAMRDALAAFIGRAIGSRSELSAGEWLQCGDAVKYGRLAW